MYCQYRLFCHLLCCTQRARKDSYDYNDTSGRPLWYTADGLCSRAGEVFQEKGDQKQAWVNAGFAVFNNEGNIRLLAAHGYQVHAAANFENGSTVSDERLEQLQRSYKKAGIGVYHIPIPRKVWNLKALILSYIQIRQISSRHYTLIHCHSPIGGVLARAAAVRQLCRNPDRRRRMGIFNRRRIERFSAQVVEKKMADVYGVKI